MSLDIYKMITDKILAQLEAGVIPWKKCWQGSEPINYVTRKPYNGVNLLLLPYGGEWLTFKQTKDKGGHVRKGERGSMIVFYKQLESVDEDTGKVKKYPMLRYSTVFHISQVDGIESKLEAVQDNDIEPIQAAENTFNDYVARSGVKVQFVKGSNSAHYSPTSDQITMPMIEQFTTAEEYYSVLFHESAHSTGHSSRLNRLTESAAFGSNSYSKEELTAEIAACMTLSKIGIEVQEVFENSVAYIKGWSKKLKEDKKFIVQASSQAQKATNLILNIAESAGA